MRKLALLLLSTAAACGSSTPPAAPPAPPSEPGAAATPSEGAPPVDDAPAGPQKPVTNATLAAMGLDPNAIDRSADPCTDFYQFSCGNWIKTTEIAGDKPIAMRSFVDISDRNEAYEHDLLEKVARTPGKDPINKQLGAFYGACMDEAAVEKAGLTPLAPLRATIAKVKDPKSLSAAVATLQASGFGVLFSYGSVQDSKDARQVIVGLDQGGLGLGDRDYYLKDEPQLKKVKDAYVTYVTDVLTIAGDKQAAASATAILALETELAKVSLDKVDRRDPVATYNRLEKAGIAKATPSFNWATFWKTNSITSDGVTVSTPKFFAGLEPLITATKPEVWRAYLTFHLVSQSAQFLTKQLVDTRFKFSAALTGTTEQQPRWKRCVGFTDGGLGDLLGQAFVKDKFPGRSKEAALEQVGAIRAAMKANLDALPWMDGDTKAKAYKKLDLMTYQIGYPNKWRSYAFKIDKKTFAANILASRKAETARDNAKIGKPDDRDDWGMTVPTVNAYYNPSRNGMVFPAGILQTPFYSVEASIPVNLGGMGVVVGHELTHGFDDQGAQYDGDGNLTNWWAPATAKDFKGRTQCVINQYAAYSVAGGGKVNGANTVGENIADIGGVKLALNAYRTLRANAPDTVVADGFTEDQQFFLGFGQAWCAKMRPEYEQMLATVDVHSPAQWRVNGALQATPAFAKAFRCKAGQPMAPAKACVVW